MDLSVKFQGVRFKNPIIAAAGTATWGLSNLRRCIEAGVGAVTIKSAILNPAMWEKRTRRSLFFLDKYGRNQVFAHCSSWFHSPDEEAKLIAEIKPIARKEGVIVIANIIHSSGSDTPDDKALISSAKQLEAAGADMLELVIASPTTHALGELSPRDKVSRYKEDTELVLDILTGKLHIPFYAKVGYDSAAEFLELLRIIEARVAACHITPEICATLIDIETGRPVVPMPKLYGRFSIGVSSFFTAFAVKNAKLQIMTSGGIWTWRDLIECLMCGATLTAVHTALLYRGYELFTRMLNGLSDFMGKKGYERVDNLRGIAVPHIDNAQELMEWVKLRKVPAESVEIVVNDAKCNGCGICAACNFDAITMKENVARIDLELCVRCGLCASICPCDAILLS